MANTYFYIYLVSAWVVLLVCSQFKPIGIRHAVIGVATIAYTLIYETIFGKWLSLYYYLNFSNSTLYMILAGVFLYPVLNMIYVLFLPATRGGLTTYTIVWIAAMLLFEYVTVLQGIVVMTGWRPIPWSIATYAFTYLWINLLYRNLERGVA
jgi:hypothetical protein